ncbi:hypothetical protein RB4381 [Rhodopirellula baltica SH 1]|uniref:Uncharacterized protein n=1 Tax=Rhodopirellula baltica (strain DSM 10527 / NCIMB 13988 / SH1) TaxID=243090 RepID=Q7USP6_RHOBA|nr:hypothetical protein RB4381 [Rhodopirellula baltica SH 1]
MSRLVEYRSLVRTVFRDARLAELKRGIGFQPFYTPRLETPKISVRSEWISVPPERVWEH